MRKFKVILRHTASLRFTQVIWDPVLKNRRLGGKQAKPLEPYQGNREAPWHTAERKTSPGSCPS